MPKSIGKISTLVSVAVAAAIMALGIYSLFKISPGFFENLGGRPRPNPAVAAPDFSLPDSSGKEIKLSELGGKIVVLNFWTSWNEVSLEELKTLNDYYENAAKKDNFAVLAVASEEGVDTARAIKTKLNLGIELLADNEGEVGEMYKIGVLPKTVFIDGSGFIVRDITGPLSLEEVRRIMASLNP